jgi:hypothetical protein
MKILRHLALLATTAGAAAILAAPIAAADTTATDTTLPTCTNVSGNEVTGGTTTECATPGNVQLNATPPVDEPTYAYPWDDEFYGPALIFGGWDGGRR